MEKEQKLNGTFYLKSGIILNDSIVFDKKNTIEAINELINEIKKTIGEAYKDHIKGDLLFGSTHINLSEIAAYKLELE